MGSSPGRDKNFHVGGSPSCGASVILPIHANIPIFVRVGSYSTSKSWKSPYDLEGDGATENQVNKYMNHRAMSIKEF